MRIELKFWFFRHYWWLVPLVFLMLAAGIIVLAAGPDFGLLVTLLGTLLSVIYFVQRQRLEELKLFRQIFADCNARYDMLNETLNAISAGSKDEPLQAEELEKLMDYFNLCGEEYLYYRQGYLFPEVWRAWHNGMKYFVENPRIAWVWKKEKEDGFILWLASVGVVKPHDKWGMPSVGRNVIRSRHAETAHQDDARPWPRCAELWTNSPLCSFGAFHERSAGGQGSRRGYFSQHSTAGAQRSPRAFRVIGNDLKTCGRFKGVAIPFCRKETTSAPCNLGSSTVVARSEQRTGWRRC